MPMTVAQVHVTGLPNYREHQAAFEKACKDLRHKVTYDRGMF